MRDWVTSCQDFDVVPSDFFEVLLCISSMRDLHSSVKDPVPRLLHGKRDEFGADIAFAQYFLVESGHLRKHLSAKGFGGTGYPFPHGKAPKLERELPWIGTIHPRHSRSILLGLAWRQRFFAQLFPLCVLGSLADTYSPIFAILSLPIFVHQSYIPPSGLLCDRCP